jgi:hypothetical protein
MFRKNDYDLLEHKVFAFFVIPGLTRNPVTLPFYDIKTRNYELPFCNTQVAGYRLSPV